MTEHHERRQTNSPSAKPPERLFLTKVVPTNEAEYCSAPHDMAMERGDLVVISTRYGRDLARILGPITEGVKPRYESIRQVFRKATDDDLTKRKALAIKEEKASRICREKIKERGMPMRLSSAHYILDESKLLFFFTAENRIDFRELVRDLASFFKLRIELRQIGTRDESRILGGVAVCGRTCCCHGMSSRFPLVSIKMAKDQNISLNPNKITGSCGRLLCCFSYEHEYYSSEKKKFPHEGCRIQTEEGLFKVTEVNIFTKKIHMTNSDGKILELPVEGLRHDPEKPGWRVVSDGDNS